MAEDDLVPDSNAIITDEDVMLRRAEQERILNRVKTYEESWEQPTPDRPPLQIKTEDYVLVRLQAMIEYAWPVDGPHATNDTKYQRASFEIYFMELYEKTLKNTEKVAIEQWKQKLKEADEKRIEQESLQRRQALIQGVPGAPVPRMK